MKSSAELKKIAQYALSDKWKTAILAGFVASLLGAGAEMVSFNVNIEFPNASDNILLSNLPPSFFSFAFATATIFGLYLLACLIIGGAIKLGYSKLNLDIIDGNSISVSQIFSQFDRLGTGFCLKFLTNIYVVLWSLLFVIPGIVKSYSYAMAPYILCENPSMTANEAITESKVIMDGRKGELFYIDLSFIGWGFLMAIPIFATAFLTDLGIIFTLLWMLFSLVWATCIGLYVETYKQAVYAAFYREITSSQL